MAEGKAGAAAALMDEGGVLYRVEDRLHGITDGNDKAGRKLPQLPPGIHQGGGVGQEFQVGHELVEFVFPGLNVGLGVIAKLSGGYSLSHAVQHLLRSLDHLTLFISLEIAFLQDTKSVFA
ncbi:hypothetical protein ES708_23044 [subsurface metagenome]